MKVPSTVYNFLFFRRGGHFHRWCQSDFSLECFRFVIFKIHLLIKVFILVTQRSTNLADPVGVVGSGDSSSPAVDRRGVLRVPAAWLMAATMVWAALDLVRTTGVRSLRLGRSVVGLGCWTTTTGGDGDFVNKVLGRMGGSIRTGGDSKTSSCSSESLVSGMTTSVICDGRLWSWSNLASWQRPVSRLRDLGTPPDREPMGVTHPLRAWLKNGTGKCWPAEIRRWTNGLMGMGRGEMERDGLAARSPAEPLNNKRFCHWPPGPCCCCCCCCWRDERLGLGLRWVQLGETALRWFLHQPKKQKTKKQKKQKHEHQKVN